MKAVAVLPELLEASFKAPQDIQERLNALFPRWLSERAYLQPLLLLLKQRVLKGDSKARAIQWLQSAGMDPQEIQQLEKTPSLFYQAHLFYNEFQGMIIVLWYSDYRKRSVRGMSFLLDFCAPWQGALKDIHVLPSRPVDEAEIEFVELPRERGMDFRAISAEHAKKEILKALHANQREGFRLPRDLVPARSIFIEHILSLPDTPETPSFSQQDFDALAGAGKSVEEARHIEQTVGGMIRLPGGENMLILRGSPDDDF